MAKSTTTVGNRVELSLNQQGFGQLKINGVEMKEVIGISLETNPGEPTMVNVRMWVSELEFSDENATVNTTKSHPDEEFQTSNPVKTITVIDGSVRLVEVKE